MDYSIYLYIYILYRTRYQTHCYVTCLLSGYRDRLTTRGVCRITTEYHSESCRIPPRYPTLHPINMTHT